MTFPGQQQEQAPKDPFEQGDGVKAVSFKNAPLQSIISIEITDDAKWLQQRDFETGEMAYWPARPGEQPNPKMAAVVNGTVLDSPWAQQSGQVGELRSIWAGKPSSLFTAIQNAKRQAGGGTPLPILRGGRLDIAFVGEEPNKNNANLNNSKVYAARYTPPPAGFGQQDAFEGGQQFTGQPAQQMPQQAPAPQQGGYAQQPAAFGQQPLPQQPPVQQPAYAQQPAGFGQPASVQQQPQQPAGDPWAAQAPQAQQPAMAAAPQQQPAGDPWASAPVAQQNSDIPPF